MPAYKDKAKGTWYASFYYEDWTGKKVKKMKRGFSTKREALEWERTFLQQQTADLEMTFENFVAVYVADSGSKKCHISLHFSGVFPAIKKAAIAGGGLRDFGTLCPKVIYTKASGSSMSS